MRSMLAVVATAPVWFALARTTTYEPGTYVPLSGFAASHHAWLLMAVACLGVMAVRRRWLVGGVVASVVVVRLAIAGTTPADPPEVGPMDCAGMNIAVGCQIGNALSALTPTRSLAELRMPLNIATAGSIVMLWRSSPGHANDRTTRHDCPRFGHASHDVFTCGSRSR